MASLCVQIEEIKSLIYSNSKANKSLAYYTLLLLQQQSNNNPSSIQTLANITSHTLISTIVIDILNHDEEIAAQALKCLGFMIYHPSIVATIPDDDAKMILEALANVIIATKIKSVCNLGVWCISMQQFDVSFLSNHLHSVLRAVLHALDNPFGSLSTTFESIQVVMKLSDQLTDKMRESSHLWSPLIYRRLLSSDRRERDMSERCLLKIKSSIFPPSAALSKALVKDLKEKLLADMKELLNQGMKAPALQAWGWFIRLLGSHALKNRHLVNDMLKIPERTFSDYSSQVKIASLVEWEGLVDALIHPSIVTCEANVVVENSIQRLLASNESGCQAQANAFSKSIKLLMTPLIGIISSECDISVHLSCLNTWCYLLQKLDLAVNHPLVIEVVLHPFFEAVFKMGPETKTSWLWSQCLDLVDDFITAKCRKLDFESSNQISHHSSARTSTLGPLTSHKCLLKQHPVKWLPWNVNQLDFFLKMINIILSHASVATTITEKSSYACNAALRIFRSLLKGVQIELKSSSINYAGIMLCLTSILRFIKEICENINSDCSGNNKLQCTSVLFLQAVTDELEPSILGSPLYKVALDLRCVENLQSVNDTCENFLGVSSIVYMDMVSPSAYLIILYICVVIHSTSDTHGTEIVLQGLHKFFKSMLFSYDPLENLKVAVGLLYKYVGCGRNLHVWTAIAEALKDCISGVKDLSSNYHIGIYHLLCYPFFAWSSFQQIQIPDEVSGSFRLSHVSAQRNLELAHVIEVWKSVYSALCTSNCSATKSISYNLCSLLNWCIDENMRMIGVGTEMDSSCKDLDLDIGLLCLSGNAVACMLEVVSADTSDGIKDNHADPQIFSDFKNALEFASRFLELSLPKIRTESPTGLLITTRVFSALGHLMSCLHLKETILSVIEIITSPLLLWLSLVGHSGSSSDQLKHLWAEILDCLRRSQPPIVFDSSFLKLQAPLLEKTLDHPDTIISELTITFWNSTYGEQIKLDYPESLLDILDKLSRSKRINLHKKSLPFLVKCNSIPELNAQRYKVNSTNNRSSKRVEFVEQKDEQFPSSKRKRLELTEHQKEVRRAQQGREMDSNGHGPGIRTYTNVDFSQGNEDSQDSQEIRNPESILEMLRRVA